MTAPTGLLEWGQSGTYNGRDDRIVITALANGATGIVKAATFTASTGLNMTVGPFTVIVSCGDSTLAVVGTLANQTVVLAAGPTSGSRTDIVWLDIDPDLATWTINLRTQADTVGRLGVKLGQVTMPQNANLATQATLSPSPVDWAPFPKPITPASLTLYRSSPISCGNAIYVDIGGAGLGWQSEVQGSAATLWTAAGFVCPSAGVYQVSGRCTWAVNSVGYRSVEVFKNAAAVSTSQTSTAAGAYLAGSILSAYPVKCAAGDVLSMAVLQSSGAALSMSWATMSVIQDS